MPRISFTGTASGLGEATRQALRFPYDRHSCLCIELNQSSDLHSCERQQHKAEAEDPKTNDDFRLGPAFKLKVMVQRGHEKNTAAGNLEAADLDDHRQSLEHEEAACDCQQQFLPHQDGHHAERAAESEGRLHLP